jgi:hypothetical protein
MLKKILFCSGLAGAVLLSLGANQSNAEGIGFGGRLGFGDFTTTGFSFGAQAEFPGLPTVPNLAFEGSVEYWWDSQKEVVLGETFESSVSIISLNGTAKYVFNLPSGSVAPYALGGLGVHFVNAKVESPSFTAEADNTELGLHLGGGVKYMTTPQVGIFGQTKYMLTFGDADLDGFYLFGGVTYYLGIGR